MDDIANKVKGIHFKAGAEMHDRILGDVLKEHDECQGQKSGSIGGGWRQIVMRNRLTKFAAAAAVIVAAILIGVSLLSSSDQQPNHEIAKGHEEPQLKPIVSQPAFEQKDIDVMLAAGNVDGLVTLVSQADVSTQVAAANYLARTNSSDALKVLERLSAGYAQDDAHNPFALAVATVRNRMEAAPDQLRTPAERRQDDAPGPGEAISRRDAPIPAGNRPVQGMGKTTNTASAETDAGPTLTKGVSGHAYYFDGQGDYIDVTCTDTLPCGNHGYTVTMWVYPYDIGKQSFFTRGELSKNELLAIVYYPKGGGLRVNHYDNDLQTDQRLSNNQWYHLTVTYDGNTTTLYLDGVYVDSLDSGSLNLQNTFTRISDYRGHSDSFRVVAKFEGAVADGDIKGFHRNETGKVVATRVGDYQGKFYSGFDGVIDEVAIFNRALPDKEIQQLLRNYGRLKGNEDGLVAYWSFDSDKGDLVKDRSPSQNHARLKNDPDAPYRQVRPSLVEGISGGAYYFDGDEDYIYIDKELGIFGGMTISVWLWYESLPNLCNGLLCNDDWAEGAVHLLLRPNGKVVFSVNGASPEDPDSDTALRADHWYHVAVTYDSAAGFARFYVDGKLDHEAGYEGSVEAVLGPLAVGGWLGPDESYWWHGGIDEVCVYDRALADNEIETLHQNRGRVRGVVTGLVGYWNFDSDGGDIVKDHSPYQNDGRLGGW
ncbi:MAG: LamG domain-containing protein [Planctomycetota bacterium]|jgi:hypothetical protein